MTKTTRPIISSPRDPATQYAKRVGAGEIPAGPLVRAACKRHLADLKHGAHRGVYLECAACKRVINFFTTVLRLPDGERAGQPFRLEPWQAFVAGSLFGWGRGPGRARGVRPRHLRDGE